MLVSDYKIGTVFSNQDLMDTFKVSNAGGMRRSLEANTLVLVNKSNSIYKNYWRNDIFYYIGMGLKGDQDIDFAQNKTLAQSNNNGVRIILFNSPKSNYYIYDGDYYLVNQPFYQEQKDEQGKTRKVIVFPLKLIG